MKRKEETAERFRSPYSSYGMAVGAVLVAVLLRWVLNSILGTRIPYLTIYPAMIIVAVTLGARPALVATLFGFLLAELFFIEPSGRITLTASLGVRFLILVLTSLFVGRVGQTLRSARAKAEAEAASARQAEEALKKAQHELELRVQERTAELTAEIEERKRAEEALRESEGELRHLSSQLLVAQEKERKEIAYDLHDNIWQILNTIKFDLEHFLSGQSPDKLAESHRSTQKIMSNIRDAVERIRTMQGDLWPSVLDDIGILATINWYCREFEKSTPGISIDKQIGVTEEEAPDSVKIVIYRVMQEALKNVAQHSGATHVVISLKKERERIEFTVNDNGGGFDLAQILFRTRPWIGFGLVGMRERIEHSGGTFDIRSGDGTGTTVQASWPLAVAHQEITERKPIRRVQEEPGDVFRVVTETISDWVYAFRVQPDGTSVWDWITPGFTTVTGYKIDDFRHDTNLSAILHPEDRHIAQERFQYIRALRPHVSEHRIVTKKGEICWVRDSINPVADPLHTGTIKVIGASQNITEHKKMEEALLRAKQEWERTFDSVPDLVAILDTQYRIVRANRAMAQRLGVTPEQCAGLSCFGCVHGSLQPLELCPHTQTLRDGQEHVAEVHEDRLGADFLVSTTPLFDEQGQMVGTVHVARDITRRKQAEEALRKAHDELGARVQERTAELSAAVEMLEAENIERKRLEDTLRESERKVRFFASECLTAQEAERKRIAGELHDSIAASLTAIKFSIEKMEYEMQQGVSPESLRDLASRVAQTIHEVRRIMADLRPSMLDDLGIVATLNWYCREYQKTYSHISVANEILISEDEVSNPLKTAIFRISQEAMNNIAKHSGASKVHFSLKKKENAIVLVIRDNGHGFDLEKVVRGMGLSSMKERTELSGGSFTIESVEDQETVIRASWPYRQE